MQLEDGGHAWLSADDVEPVAPREPWVALLPALQGWLGAVRFKPKFRTPLELELFAG